MPKPQPEESNVIRMEFDRSAWLILRCAGRSTLRLADTLALDGYKVWTPRETRRIRIPRMNVRRDVIEALMPSYVFAKAEHLIDMLELANMPVKPRRGTGPAHDGFSVMHWHDRIPLIADIDLTQLRRLEAKRTPIKKAERSFPIGSSVRVETGSFGGMKGKVDRSDTAHTLVCFSDKYVVKINTSLLLPDDIGLVSPCEGTAAKRAA